ncbi:hypothetical protein H0H93_012287 [Arthromyces matolae]|nr:hypothetical protein H0H93_012287 [Arthromyces matolae]
MQNGLYRNQALDVFTVVVHTSSGADTHACSYNMPEEFLPYDELISRLETISSGGLTHEAKIAAQNVMQQEVQKTLGPEQVIAEARQLVDNVVKIDQGFERIKIQFATIDAGHFRGKPVEQLQPQWVKYQRCFVHLICKSLAAVRKTNAYIKEFLYVLLPNLEGLNGYLEYKEAIEDLREFAERKNPFQQDLQDVFDGKHSSAYTELRCEVRSFRNNFELFLEEQGIKLDRDIVRLQEEISDLVWQNKRHATMISSLRRTFDMTVSSADEGSLAALSALSVICPTSALSVFLTGVRDVLPDHEDVVSFIYNTSGFRDEIKAYQSQIDEKKPQLRIPSLVQVILRSQGVIFEDGSCHMYMRSKGGVKKVTHDAISLASELEQRFQAEKNGLTHAASIARIRLIKAAYEVILGFLKEYVREIERHSFRFGQGLKDFEL